MRALLDIRRAALVQHVKAYRHVWHGVRASMAFNSRDRSAMRFIHAGEVDKTDASRFIEERNRELYPSVRVLGHLSV